MFYLIFQVENDMVLYVGCHEHAGKYTHRLRFKLTKYILHSSFFILHSRIRQKMVFFGKTQITGDFLNFKLTRKLVKCLGKATNGESHKRWSLFFEVLISNRLTIELTPSQALHLYHASTKHMMKI